MNTSAPKTGTAPMATANSIQGATKDCYTTFAGPPWDLTAYGYERARVFARCRNFLCPSSTPWNPQKTAEKWILGRTLCGNQCHALEQ